MTTGRHFAIDKHPQKEAIIQAIMAGESFRAISARFGNVSKQAITRYCETILKKDVAAVVANRRESSLRTVDGCLNELESLVTASKNLLEKWNKKLDEAEGTDPALRRDVVMAMKNIRDTVESIGRFLGMVKDVTVVNNISTETAEFVNHIIEILEDKLADQPELLQEIEDEFNGR